MRWILLFVVLFTQCSQIDDLREHMNKHCVQDAAIAQRAGEAG